MSSHLLRPAAVLLLPILAIGLLTGPLAAQSQNDIRRENERLRTLTTDLTKELEAIRADLDTLRSENERLSRLLAAAARTVSSGATPTPPPVDPPVTIDETFPGASPRALFAAIAADYQKEVTDLEMGEAGDANRATYLRKLSRWATRINRQMKQPIEWHVQPVGPATRTARGFILRLRAIDPKTEAELGDPFDVFLTRAQASRLEAHLSRTDMKKLLLMGTLRPRVHVNEDRMTEGAFSSMPLVGPFAEFAFGVNVNSLLPPTSEKDEQSATAPASPAKDGSGGP